MTIYDIAKATGVSITTVSRVLNKKGNVSTKTRAMVEEFLEASGYEPNEIARSLATKQTKTVGIICANLQNSHHVVLVSEFENEISKHGYHCFIGNLGGNVAKIADYLALLTSRKVEGVVFIGSVLYDELTSQDLYGTIPNIPAVFVNGLHKNDGSHPHFYSIVDDEAAAFYKATTHLGETLKRKHILLISDADTSSERRKIAGYRKCMDVLGLPTAVVHCSSPPSYQLGVTIAERISREYPQTDALLFTEDITAAGCICALRERGVRIPDEIAIIGTNNSAFTEISYPTLSSIDNSPVETGTISANVLLQALQGKQPEKSTGFPASWY